MKIMMFSMHGSAATEISILCQKSGVEMWMANPGCSIIRTLTKPEEIPYFESLGTKFFKSDEEVLQNLMEEDFRGIVLATPEQISQYKETKTKIPYIIRHGLNSFKKFNKHGVRNFITCCHRAASNIPDCHYFHNRKLIPFDKFMQPKTPIEMKASFRSYIHHYEKWKTAFDKFDKLNSLIAPEQVVNYGAGSVVGEVPDLPLMDLSRATVHIKDGNAVCNAVIRSMVMRTPVVMDRESFEKCYFDDIKGIVVKDNIELVAKELQALNSSDELLEQRVAEIDLKQFEWDSDLGERFCKFISTLKV